MLDWIVDVVASLGYVGIALLMLLENLIPPIPSELIMPLAGFAAAQGKLSFPGIVIAGITGSIVGALPWYFVGWHFGRQRVVRLADRYGKWIGVSGEDIEASVKWFGRHGGKTVLIGRVVPAARTLISVPAGITRMKLLPFLLCSLIGTTIWTTVLAAAGYLLQANWRVVEDYIGLFGTVSMAIGVTTMVAVILYRRRQASRRAASIKPLPVSD